MATVKKGVLIADKEWVKHLRKFGKKNFWAAHRNAEKKLILKETKNG
jgi:hypothetical protein